jgi:hypothetical protein
VTPVRRLLNLIPTLAALGIALATLGAVAPAGAQQQVELTPATGGKGVPTLAATNIDLASVGYEQSEYLIGGTARSYTSAQPLTTDGKWTVTPASNAAYKTRVVVYRPTDPKKFNGTVMVEWLNVSAGLDSAPIWLAAHTELIRQGFAWIGVSAQSVGVEGGSARAIVPNLDLVHADPERYGTLTHPGDSYSYDIYTQAGEAVRDQTATLLGTLKPKHVIAAGESQSAFRMVTYIDAFGKQTTSPYDGYLVYSRGGSGAALSQAPQADVAVPDGTLIRADLGKPVLTFTTETDFAILGAYSAQQPDSKWFREWQVAGTSHADTYTLTVGTSDAGSPQAYVDQFQTMLDPPSKVAGGFITCDTPINTGPMTYVLRTAIDDLNTWVVNGTEPPKAPRFKAVPGTGNPPQFRLDADGNVLGGIRTPHVDTPVAVLSGLGQSGASFCKIFGTTKPFDAPTTADLYASHAKFVQQWNHATDDAVSSGFLLKVDARGLKAAARQSTVGTPQ